MSSDISIPFSHSSHILDFCDRHLQLLFTILKQSHSTQIRANVIIALGDMAFRFPNLIEPWSEHM